MPSKRGFGNTRKKGSTYRYGVDSKNPIMMKSPMREEKKKEVKMKPKTNLGVLRETHLSAREKTGKLLKEKGGELTPEQRKVLESFMKSGR
jgi:hypothetical protein